MVLLIMFVMLQLVNAIVKKILLEMFVMRLLMDGGISQPLKVNSFDLDCYLCFSKNIIFLACECHISCYEENTDYEGDDLSDGQSYDVANAHDCQAKCHVRTDCLYWTYLDISSVHEWAGMCWLKSGKGSIKKEGHDGFTSGPKYCSKY